MIPPPDQDQVWFKCPICLEIGHCTVYESYQEGYDFTIRDAPLENIHEIIAISKRGELQCFVCKGYLLLSLYRGARILRSYQHR